MGITTIFDLRSDTEIAKYNSPIPDTGEINIVHIPIFKTEDYSPETMARYVLPSSNLHLDLIIVGQTLQPLCKWKDGSQSQQYFWHLVQNELLIKTTLMPGFHGIIFANPGSWWRYLSSNSASHSR
jgi:hypothetical protein